MSLNRRNNIFIPRLKPREIEGPIIRNWINIQADALSATVQIIEANIDKISIYDIPKKKFSGRRIAIDLVIKKFLKSNKNLDREIERLKSDIEDLGMLIPISDIKNIHPKDLRHGINILSHIVADFSFSEFLFHLKDTLTNDSPKLLSLPLEGLLYLLEKYINLILYSDELIESVSFIEEWFSHYIPFDSDRMPTYQLISWIAKVFDSVASKEPMGQMEDEYPASVQKIINTYQDAFLVELVEVRDKREKKFYFRSFPDFKKDLAALIDEDQDILLIYCTLLDAKETKDLFYNQHLKNAFGEESFMKKMGSLLSRKNVVKTFKSIIYKENSIHDLSLFRQEESVYDKILLHVNRLNSKEKRQLIDRGISKIKQDQSYERRITNFATKYHMHLSDTFFKPFGYWEYHKKELYPLIDLADQKVKDAALFFLKTQKKHEEEEAELLAKYLKSIKVIQTRTSLDSLIKAVPIFFYKSNQRRWQFAIKEAEEAIKHRNAFRKMKMRELGIDLVKGFTDSQKEIYLTEMLKIEEEVQEFVPFVTASFKSALPSKRTTVFDAFRHQSDGVEFDPETTLDPDKWLRGNVMKTLKYKVKKGEVTQVNCFCLDLSGSMDRERMRNLYKMLYLLVIGLQSRKSFDAFHFFSDRFIQGVDFSGEYTKKSLLFRVLTIVSNIQGPRLVYEGIAGTNISDGIDGCIKRMTHFIDALRSKRPDLNLSCSMFVITDGEPSLGIVNLEKLNTFVEQKRQETNFAIKAIYIKSKADRHNFITTIFGKGNAVETTSFEEGVQKLTAIMTKTYKEQRIQFKWDQKKAKLFSNNESDVMK